MIASQLGRGSDMKFSKKNIIFLCLFCLCFALCPGLVWTRSPPALRGFLPAWLFAWLLSTVPTIYFTTVSRLVRVPSEFVTWTVPRKPPTLPPHLPKRRTEAWGRTACSGCACPRSARGRWTSRPAARPRCPSRTCSRRTPPSPRGRD